MIFKRNLGLDAKARTRIGRVEGAVWRRVGLDRLPS